MFFHSLDIVLEWAFFLYVSWAKSWSTSILSVHICQSLQSRVKKGPVPPLNAKSGKNVLSGDRISDYLRNNINMHYAFHNVALPNLRGHFLPSTVQLWNDLPAGVLQEDLHSFKQRCNDALKEGNFDF